MTEPEIQPGKHLTSNFKMAITLLKTGSKAPEINATDQDGNLIYSSVFGGEFGLSRFFSELSYVTRI